MSQKLTEKELLAQFCEDWNNHGFSPKLYPIHCVPEKFAESVICAQLDQEADNSVALPEDVQNADDFLAWAKGFEQKDFRNFDVVFLQVAAVDKNDRVAVFDVEMTVGNEGYYDAFNHIKIHTTLTGFSRRKTWIEPGMLKKHDDYRADSRANHLYDHAEERVRLFRKALQAMITAKHKDVSEKLAKRQKRESENLKMQVMIDEIKSYGIATKELGDKKVLDASVENELGRMIFKKGAVECKITTASNTNERRAFATLIGGLL